MREDQMPERDRPDRGEHQLTRTLMWIGVAGLGVALTFVLARALVNRRTADPTTQRIQQLIDEANQLLKALDEQKHSA
jgi:membrane protein implicated in regulation of membrane protease activity